MLCLMMGFEFYWEPSSMVMGTNRAEQNEEISG